MFSLEILNKIISDVAPESKTLSRVGIVGSFARGDSMDESDIDLVFDTESKLIDEAVLSTGLKVKAIIGDQFRKDVDIINYQTILKRKESHNPNHCPDGYQRMFDDLVWIWRRAT